LPAPSRACEPELGTAFADTLDCPASADIMFWYLVKDMVEDGVLAEQTQHG
jgi:hypothetical protein